MPLSSLKIVHFKNHRELSWSPSKKWNIITGLNGKGKTNLLDAIYMSCVLKSFLKHSLDSCIMHGEVFFRIEAIDSSNNETIIKYPNGGPRQIELNGKRINKAIDFIGRYPVMVIQPIDDYKLMEGSSARRRIIDQAIAQVNPAFLKALMDYNKILKQRNALLKQIRQRGGTGSEQLEIYRDPMNNLNALLVNERRSFIDDIRVALYKFYETISGGVETPGFSFEPSSEPDDFLSIQSQTLSIDIGAGRTTRGAHLDDVNMTLDEHPIKSIGSQGQRKSFLLAVKLAIYDRMRETSGKLPILLLDDLFDKLDNHRVTRLLSILSQPGFGQVFISDKDDEHLKSIFHLMNLEINHVRLPQQ